MAANLGATGKTGVGGPVDRPEERRFRTGDSPFVLLVEITLPTRVDINRLVHGCTQ
jgi:hypothetical protein